MARNNRKNQGDNLNTRAQITVFIIIGLLVVIAFGITLYVGGKMGERIETKQSQQRIEQLGIQPIQDYITTCLTLATTEGLNYIGRQGGAIYQKQGGITPDFLPEDLGKRFVQYTDEDQTIGTLEVAYLITPPTGNVGTLFFSETPSYPFPDFPIPPGKTEPRFKGYYGTSQLPSLYKKTPEGNPVTGSIQENLETFIAKRTIECAEWKTFEEKGYMISAGAATASLIFASEAEQFIGEQNVNVELIWPVEITTPGEDKTLLTSFVTRLPVRLATIYYTIKQIIDADVTDISYTPENMGQFTTIIYPYGTDSSFIIVKDAQSIVKNEPFEFWIPRKNRKPALWKIDTSTLNDVTFHVTPEGRGAKITTQENLLRIEDPCQEAGIQNPYIIELQSSEPDEDKVKYEVYIPQTTSNEIPIEATTFDKFSITIIAKDKSDNPQPWYDSQEIPLQVALCEIR